MLLFLDDSFESTPGGFRHVLGGFCIGEPGYRSLVAAVEDAKARYFVQDRDMSADERERVWETHFVVGEPPSHVELKASLLLSSSVLRRTGQQPRAAVRLALEVLESLQANEARVFSVVSQFTKLEQSSRDGGIPKHMVQLFEQVEDWVARWHPDQMVVPVLDGSSPSADRALARRMIKTMLRPETANRLPHILVSPLIVDTKTNPGVQVADLVSHVLLNHARPEPERKPLEAITEAVLTLSRSRD